MTADVRRVSFEVFGVAQPKGSMKAFVPRGWSRPILTADNPRTKGWQQLVAEQAQAAARDGLFLGPVALAVTFHLPRPASLPRRVVHHLKKPDLDKLVRATKDALTGVLYRDDACVVCLQAAKVYAGIGATPRACISLAEAAPPEAQPAPLFPESFA